MTRATLLTALLSLSFALVFNSCKKDEDPCDGVTCQNGGSCNNGNCNCTTGFEGGTCGTEWRAKFIGLYNGNFACSTGNFTINLTITNSAAGVTSIVMSDGTDSWVATLTGSSSVNIASQSISGGNTISGSGQLAGNILTLNLALAGGGATVNCTYTGTKQ